MLQPRSGLSDPDLVGRYLYGCDVFANWDVHMGYDQRGLAEWFEANRTVTTKAPDFAPAQYSFAESLAIAANSAPPEGAHDLRQQSQAHLEQAIARAPDSPDGPATKAALLPNTRWGERERLLRQAVAKAPDWPIGNLWLGTLLVSTGQVKDGLAFTHKVANGYDWGISDALLSCLGDRPEQAVEQIVRYRALVPDSLFAQDAHLMCLEAMGRWEEAQRLLGVLPQIPSPYRGEAVEAFLVAAQSRALGDIQRARRLALANADGGPAALAASISLLSALGRIDDASALAQRFDPNSTQDATVFMFSSLMRNMRRDPRFVRLAARIGLVDYWRKSGHWPDFCAEPSLPYDCRVEAAKYGEQR